MVFVFKKCARQRAVPIAKAKGKKAATLKRLRSFLDAEEPKTVNWLASTWNSQQNAITYKELREAILSGRMSEEQLKEWQKSYAMLVNNKLAPQWVKAMATAAEEQNKRFPHFLYDPRMGAAQAYIQERGTSLVTNLVAEQENALRAMVAQAAHYDGMTADSLSRIMRPVIGLTKPQAKANLNYYNAVLTGLREANPSMRQATAEKQAREAAAKYAARQHRYRAMTIARTELATAYNEGAYGATHDAQEKGYIGDCKKTWLMADDERVCSACSSLDGESVNMEAAFSSGVKLPPAHPNCRCAVAFEEITDSLMPTLDPLPLEPAVPVGVGFEQDGGIIATVVDGISSPISNPIEFGHPADVAFGGKELNQRQQRILDQLPGYGSQAVVKKRDVSMLDLSAMTAKTGDEFAMFTRKGERLLVRGNVEGIPLKEKELIELSVRGYRWSGHVHPGITETDLIYSDGDKKALELFKQKNSVIYNAVGRYKLINEVKAHGEKS